MYYIEIHSLIDRLDATLNYVGVWRKRDASVVRKIGGYLVFITCGLGLIVGLISGAATASSKDESLFIGATALYSVVAIIRNNNLRSKRETIMTLLRDNCSHTLENKNDFKVLNERLKKFLNFVVLYMITVAVAVSFLCITPALSKDNTLPVSFGYPLNWTTNHSVYFAAYVFFALGSVYTGGGTYSSILVWYLMIGFSVQYDILGFRLRDLGVQKTNSNRKLLPERQSSFHSHLLELVQLHKRIIQSVNEFKSLFSYIFFIQIMTSAITVCGSVYALTLAPHDTVFQLVLYSSQMLYGIFDIFVVMYLGNDIKLSSNRLSYCVFESNWMQEPESTKKCLIVLTENLKKPHELMIYTLYPINLETFTSVSVYFHFDRYSFLLHILFTMDFVDTSVSMSYKTSKFHKVHEPNTDVSIKKNVLQLRKTRPRRTNSEIHRLQHLWQQL